MREGLACARPACARHCAIWRAADVRVRHPRERRVGGKSSRLARLYFQLELDICDLDLEHVGPAAMQRVGAAVWPAGSWSQTVARSPPFEGDEATLEYRIRGGTPELSLGLN